MCFATRSLTGATALWALLDEPADRRAPAPQLSLDELFGEFERVADRAHGVSVRERGPRIGWQAPFPGEAAPCELRTHCIDLDTGRQGEDPAAFRVAGLARGFEGSAFDVAARAYRRERGWELSPGDGGV
jgi:ribosomal protein S18 acetylase RimI-like enzyme